MDDNNINIKNQNERNYIIVAMVISIVLSSFEVIPYLVLRPSMPVIGDTSGLIIRWAVSFISIVASFAASYLILTPFKRKASLRRLIFLTAFIFSFLIVFCFGLFSFFSFLPSHWEPLPMIFPRAFFVSMVSTTYTYIVRINFQKQVFELENEILKKESIKGQYEALKNELSPHFLFNSLNALQSIIREEPGKAGQYVSHLSQVLRYTLQGNDNQFVSLKEEMELAHSYIYLLEKRYGNNLMVEIEIPEEYRLLRILPLTLQSLIENAVKHNEISSRFPLVLKIGINDKKFLVVTNNIQSRQSREASLGIGLSNLSQRYKILSGEDVSISKTGQEFRVEVPLKN